MPLVEPNCLQSHLLWREFNAFSAAVAIYYKMCVYHSTRYPSLLVNRHSMELLYIASCETWTPDLLILSQKPYPVDHILDVSLWYFRWRTTAANLNLTWLSMFWVCTPWGTLPEWLMIYLKTRWNDWAFMMTVKTRITSKTATYDIKDKDKHKYPENVKITVISKDEDEI